METDLETDQGLKDFWKVYESNYEQLTEALTRDLAKDREFGPVINSMSDSELEEQTKTARALLEQAVLRNDWKTYLEYLRQQGSAYAKAGISFPAWMKASGAMRYQMVPHLVDAYGKEPDRLVPAIVAMDNFVERALAAIGEEYLSAKEQVVAAQVEAIKELSTPVLQLREGLLILPIIGLIDSHRAAQITEALLEAIRDKRAKAAVVDITGVADVDSRVANHLVQTVEAARLMGTFVIVTGISPEIAGTLVAIGVDLSKMHTVGDLQGGIDEADRMIGYKVTRVDGSASRA